MKELKLTTVKVLKEIYEKDFKIEAIKSGINFQKLVNRALCLYTRDTVFKSQINAYDEFQMSGSAVI
jgi:hypothetical protein